MLSLFILSSSKFVVGTWLAAARWHAHGYTLIGSCGQDLAKSEERVVVVARRAFLDALPQRGEASHIVGSKGIKSVILACDGEEADLAARGGSRSIHSIKLERLTYDLSEPNIQVEPSVEEGKAGS